MAIYDVDGSILTTETLGNADTFIYSINHRGYSEDAPENTIPAFILSKVKGFSYVECDVQFTSDAVAVLMHDTSINRTCRNADGTSLSSTVNIGDITYAQSQAYDAGIWMGAEYAGTKIPTFAEFILTCKQLSLHPFIELKDVVNGTYWTDARIKAVADAVTAVGMENNVSFISFSTSALSKIAVYFPHARLGLGFTGTYSTQNFTAFISNAQTLQADGREVVTTVKQSSMTSEFYNMLSDAEISPIVWTVNSESDVLNLNRTVVGVLSDLLNAGEIIENDIISQAIEDYGWDTDA